MSDFSSQGVGAAACAKAGDASMPNAAVMKKVLIEILVIVVPPGGRNRLLPQRFEQITNAVTPSIRRDVRPSRFLCDFVIPRIALRDYGPVTNTLLPETLWG